MRRVEVHFGVIRDKPGIYEGLRQSQSSNRQLAVCYNSGGTLIVKICTVKDIVGDKEGTIVLLHSEHHDPACDSTIMLDQIESIYPIRDFVK